MINRMKRIIKTGLILGLTVNSLMAYSITPIVIKQETAQYILDIKYPQGFKSPTVNASIKEFIANTQKSFMGELSEDASTPADAPGKTGLNITYSVPYKTPTALSIRFNISIFHKGAAHPSNTVVVKNYVNGKSMNLADLFVSGADYLTPISALAKKDITKKNISDEQWISEGTKPTAENYSVWFFTHKGIAVIFNSYQVAAYVYGEQTVTIPLSLISRLVKSEIAQSVWGN
ncbi:DUF3298 domain-containing protein [Legionella sp. km535]|uniref:DUF3298 and DUF4163 domain-containing protein n=1 Tax=Legionella sp. km535 TaxID=2498107 RepID=UPI000F8DA4FC|nr:DUF3298 and DUF4163 domain-containing protein [Legionella sp. km535]RUR20300.1 DUF3298 domain-containing protein [Legionella sp. km535]